MTWLDWLFIGAVGAGFGYWIEDRLYRKIRKVEGDQAKRLHSLEQQMKELDGRIARFENPSLLSYGELAELRKAINLEPPAD